MPGCSSTDKSGAAPTGKQLRKNNQVSFNSSKSEVLFKEGWKTNELANRSVIKGIKIDFDKETLNDDFIMLDNQVETADIENKIEIMHDTNLELNKICKINRKFENIVYNATTANKNTEAYPIEIVSLDWDNNIKINVSSAEELLRECHTNINYLYNDCICFNHINSIYNNIYDIEYFNDNMADHCTYILNNFNSLNDNYMVDSREALKDLLFFAGLLFDLPYKKIDSAEPFQHSTVMTDTIQCSSASTAQTDDNNSGVLSNCSKKSTPNVETDIAEVLGEHKTCHIDNVSNENDIFTIYVGIANQVVLALADTGAVYSSIHPDLVKQLNIPTHELPVEVYGKGIGGEYMVDRFVYEKITLHDIRFDDHPFKVNKCGTSQFVMVLGADFFRKFELIINPANRSVGRQVAKNSFWELVMDTRNKKCCRKLFNLPVQVDKDINVKVVREKMLDFKIKLKNIELLQEKMCHCDDEVINNLNKVIVFNPSYDDFSNSVLHNNEINVSNRGDIVPNLILNPLVTNVQFPKFTVTKHCFSNKAILYKGTTIGSVTSPLCKVIDADSPMRLNGSLLCPDIDLNSSSINLNEKSVTLNFTINNDLHCSEIMNSTFIDGKELSRVDSTLQSVSNIMDLYDSGLIDELFKEEHSNYDLMPPSELDRGAEFEDDDLKDEWTREKLVEN
ncbi:unnamed protein product [Rotaria magnacalcarata]|uniref:Uncharacterized protein n=1 Tax=Rotaria magnacalcarata TaxID=392030 RepID=A0A819Y610_9BILA|nr:unnamed protein product [Rotaria magnacalcarata]